MKNEPSFDQVAREFGAMIKRIARSHEAKPQLAEELVQDIHLTLWRALPSFRGEASLRTFVARIATNRAVTHVLHAMKTPPADELDDDIPEPGEDPETSAITLDMQARLVAAVRALPLTYRQVALLTLEGFKPQEIADTLGTTANAVSIRLTRAKQMLRTLIGDIP